MNAARNFITARWKLLLCIFMLLGLGFCLVQLFTPRRAPFEGFGIATNRVRGVQTMQLAVTNTLNASSIAPITELMRDGHWLQASPQRFEINTRESDWLTVRLLQTEEEFPWIDFPKELWISPSARLTFRFPIPTESSRWRLKLVCTRPSSKWETRIAKWFEKLNLEDPFSGTSEHIIEFGK